MAFDIDATLGYVVNRTSVVLRQALQRRFRQAGQSLTAEEWALLGQLWRQDGRSRQELADLTIKDQTTVTRLLDALVRKGLARRETDAADRRISRIWLTPAGRHLEMVLVPLALELLRDAVQGIPARDVQITLHTLRQIQANLLDADANRPHTGGAR